jgi:NTE family protein
MQAYAIFAGGGVKGATFAGCLIEAKELDIEFIGYGGTSAGSLVALLASIGYSPDEIRDIMVKEVDYPSMLGGDLNLLKNLDTLQDRLESIQNASKIGKLWKGAKLGTQAIFSKKGPFESIIRIRDHFGLYDGQPLVNKARELIIRRYPDLKARNDITFGDLAKHGAKPLKIVASQLHTHQARLYTSAESEESVLKALRASTCFPFVFQPVSDGIGRLVDGGLASNLPVFLFNQERLHDRRPVIAFDLQAAAGQVPSTYTLKHFCGDLLETALSAGDALHRGYGAGDRVIHVPINMPEGLTALRFELTDTEKENLVARGQISTNKVLKKELSQARYAQKDVEKLQAGLVKVDLMEAVLSALAQAVAQHPGWSSPRCYVMVPSGDHYAAAYEHGFKEGDLDSLRNEWRLPIAASPWGEVREQGRLRLVQLYVLRAEPEKFGLTPGEVRHIPHTRQTLFCRPVFEYTRDAPEARAASQRPPVIAILGIDTESTLDTIGWPGTDIASTFLDATATWAHVIGKLLD